MPTRDRPISHADRVRERWVVHTKGEPGKAFEIAVLRDTNAHGKASHGWYDDDKLLISNSGGPCRDTVDDLTWDALVAAAHRVANTLNRREGVLL